MKVDHDGFTLSSGKQVYANAGIASVDEDGQLTCGYDGFISTNMTPEEMDELARHMIQRWEQFLINT